MPPMSGPATAATLNRMFCESQPIELNASVAPIASRGDVDVGESSRSSVEVLSAVTVTLPPLAVTRCR